MFIKQQQNNRKPTRTSWGLNIVPCFERDDLTLNGIKTSSMLISTVFIYKMTAVGIPIISVSSWWILKKQGHVCICHAVLLQGFTATVPRPPQTVSSSPTLSLLVQHPHTPSLTAHSQGSLVVDKPYCFPVNPNFFKIDLSTKIL